MVSKRKIIDVEEHAFLRAEERGRKYGLNYLETRERIFRTVKQGHLAKRKHLSAKGKTYYLYFNDNLSFYVIAREREGEEYIHILIKTVIIEEGRE